MERPKPSVFIEFEVGEALPSSERLSWWVSAMAFICNDSILDAVSILRAGNADRPDELAYFTRIAAGHLYEAAKFIANTAEWLEVKKLVAGLAEVDPKLKADWDLIVALWDPEAPIRPALDNARHQIFHYPELYGGCRGVPEVTAALERMKDQTGRLELGKGFGSYRFLFADDLALDMIIEPEPGGDQEAFERFAGGLKDHVLALQRCSEAVLAVHFMSLGTMVEVPPPPALSAGGVGREVVP